MFDVSLCNMYEIFIFKKINFILIVVTTVFDWTDLLFSRFVLQRLGWEGWEGGKGLEITSLSLSHHACLFWREKMEKLLRKNWEIRCPVCHMWFPEGQPSLEPRAGERVNPVISTLVSRFLCCMSVFTEGSLGTPRTASAIYYLFKTRQQCVDTDGCVEVVYH